MKTPVSYLYRILFSVLVLFNIILLIKLDKTKASIRDYESITSDNTGIISNMIENEKIQHKLNGRIFKGRKGTLDSLKYLIRDKPKLMFYFNENTCETCVDQAIQDLLSLGKKIGNENIIILTNYLVSRQALYLQKRLDDKFQVFNINSDTLISPSEIYFNNSPSFSVLDEDLRLNNYFIYSITRPELNTYYYNFIENFFSGEN